jgi:hypothetical protein
MHTRSCRVHKYLYRLFENGHLRFVVKPPRLRHMRVLLPEIVQQFLAVFDSLSVRNFHYRLHPQYTEPEHTLKYIDLSMADVTDAYRVAVAEIQKRYHIEVQHAANKDSSAQTREDISSDS